MLFMTRVTVQQSYFETWVHFHMTYFLGFFLEGWDVGSRPVGYCCWRSCALTG